MINILSKKYNYSLSLGSSESFFATYLENGAVIKTIGVAIAQASIHELIQAAIFGGKSPVFNDVIKKLTNPDIIVDNSNVEITVATVNLNIT